MRLIPIIFLLATLISCENSTSSENESQEDQFINPIELPNKEYAVYKYDSLLGLKVLTYQYAGLWDIDNDGNFDSLAFIGNGGAHEYFHFQINLSSDDKDWITYSTFYIDMPYFDEIDSLGELGESFPQFVVYDFDNDGIKEIYLNIDNSFASIPVELQDKGLISKRIVFDFRENQLFIEDFVEGYEEYILNEYWPHWRHSMDSTDIELR